MSGSTYNLWHSAITKEYYYHLLATGKRDLVYVIRDIMGQDNYFLVRR